MNLRRLAAAAAAGLVLVGGVAAPASAETLVRPKGAKTVTIQPIGAPAGAAVTKARVTVKKGKKTVAKNKASYRAKKGAYKVTSTVTYKPRTSAKRAAAADVFAKCRVTTRTITSDRTTRTDWFGDGEYVDYSGQVTVRYSGTCTDSLWVGSSLKTLTWASSWSEDDYLWTDYVSGYASDLDAKYDALTYKVGDATYVSGSEMAANTLPVIGWNYGPARTTKNTRTVTVR